MKRRQFDCDGCRYQFSVRVGTLFHDSKLPLWKWFLAVYMMGESKKGVSANQLEADARRVLQDRLVSLPPHPRGDEREGPTILPGIMEADETFVGGKLRAAAAPGAGAIAATTRPSCSGRSSAAAGPAPSVAPRRQARHRPRFPDRRGDDDAEAIYTDLAPLLPRHWQTRTRGMSSSTTPDEEWVQRAGAHEHRRVRPDPL